MKRRTSKTNRRRFLRGVLGAGAAVAVPCVVPGRVLGLDGAVLPSETILLGGIGIGRRGGYVLGCFMQEPDVRVVAVCDVRADRRQAVKQRVDARYGGQCAAYRDFHRRQAVKQRVDARYGGQCAAYRDFQELLARDDIDAVLITTGSNWHALLSIYSAKAGKDVYCEKPCTKTIAESCTKTIAESLALAETFQRTGRIFQGGMQRRNLPHAQFAVKLAQTGKLGKLLEVHAHPGGLGTGMSGWASAEPEPPPEVVDWDRFLGPAAWRPYTLQPAVSQLRL